MDKRDREKLDFIYNMENGRVWGMLVAVVVFGSLWLITQCSGA